ncbi:hypothetical protein JVT61DRAFT_10614 [Boletus reticuloceps]|uniref:Uncharacterized protein n=1 Tax=Boletus reticuloceps TaxID=495285 RepID=A0A8I3A5A1_9AGAM|nr:hypothetical protein JVT61DRAFT_10614 [Boletus reticuloceps]
MFSPDPDDDALQNPEKYSKALSFSPDIIPLYGAKADHDALVHPMSWRGFAGMPIVGGDVNNVYIRGYGSGGPYIVTLRVIPSELILWPQVWSSVQPVPSGPVGIAGGDITGPYTSNNPLWFRPPHTAGNACSLIANVFKYDPVNEHKHLQDYEPISSLDLGVDEFLSFLSKDKNFTFYNVVVADPTLKHVSANTRLRMFSKSPVPVTFRLDWHEGAPAPAGLEVSLNDDRGKITIPRTPLSSFGEHGVLLEPSYDGILTLNIFSPVANAHHEPYSGLSLRVLKSGISGSRLTAGLGLPQSISPVDPPQLLGALNVIFDPHSTRNIRFASPSATQLRESKNCPGDVCHCPVEPGNADCAVIPVTKPAATGWWFRAQVNDVNIFPHTAPGGYSPDIQPIGTDLTAPGLWSSLENPSSDYAKDKLIELVGGEDNYIFVRGHSTIADIDIQSRVFAIKGAPILHPSEYATQGISAQVFGGAGTVDQQTISVADADQFYLFSRPFDIKAPPNPNPGSHGGSWMSETHYCLIAEVRQKRKCSLVYPSWPTEQTEDLKTLQDFQQWVTTCPLVCYRNLGWVPGTRKPGEVCLTWQCSTRLVIPESSFYSSFWTIIIECDSPIIPPGSKWSLTCDDNVIFPDGVCFGNIPISAQSPVAGSHFTGATPSSTPCNLILTVTWCDGNSKIPPPSIKCKLAITEVTMLSPLKYLAGQPPAGSQAWPFYVASKYPYLGDKPNPSPLPSFKAIGLNTWPYPDSPQTVLGQVALAAKI